VRLLADSGLWCTDSTVAPTPLVAVLEVSGALLSWTVDDPSGAAATQIVFTDPVQADWLWRVVGDSGHAAFSEAVTGRAADAAQTIELTEVDLVSGSLEPLRRLAIGHWLRRWWPASERDGIVGLDHALLDAEIALLTTAAQDFFTEDTLDDDVATFLRPHAEALYSLVRGGDPRVLELARACAELADDIGVGAAGWSDLSAALDDSIADQISHDGLAAATGRRDDYALAAGPGAGTPSAHVIARGVASVNWAGVPPGIFDAGEDTVDWWVEVAGSEPVAQMRVATIGPGSPAGVMVCLASGEVTGEGFMDAAGSATFPIVGSGRPISESAAWNHDWRGTIATVGVRVNETPETRERVRRFARARLARPGNDAFLAEVLAAESDY
jgi:hypothetical protein